ncbi:unnamed protein product [Acanthoscelides obtectus]|uniref:Transposase n=1 Tax=Acanthoscelides obtectus TaxID=200917 RepID=A0A9P0VNQ5_ACAOB|nr:unnamed protein product [Acanthoscelides obtectus]CAK1685458.1 hypothetical protein AOBTE_LOCUS35423 [Acanthoscelides obtectus]
MDTSGSGSSCSEFDLTTSSSHESSVNYDRELDAILERYEEAAKNEDHYLLTAEILNERHENSNVHRKYVQELVAKFRETESVANKKRKIENPIRNEAIEVGVLGQVYVDPTLSTRKLVTVCGVSRRTVQRILKAHYAIDPALTAIIENQNDRRYIANRLMFQQDGGPPHYALRVRQYVDQKSGAIEWPPRSPDLSPLDFFMWGHLKSKIYATQPTSLEDLRQRIVNEFFQITPQILQNSMVRKSD